MDEQERNELIYKIMLRNLRFAYWSPEEYETKRKALSEMSDVTLVFNYTL